MKKAGVACGVDVQSKYSVKPIALEVALQRNGEKDLAIKFKILPNGVSYNALTAHDFKEYVSD